MSKRCKRCGYQNEDDRYFCQQCGESLDDNVRVLLSYEKMKKDPSHIRKTVSREDEDDEFIPAKREPEKKPYAALAAALVCLVVIGGVVAWLLLSH